MKEDKNLLGTKQCSKCKNSLSLICFGKFTDKKGVLRYFSACKECREAAAKVYRRTDRAKTLEKESRIRNKVRRDASKKDTMEPIKIG